MSTAPEPSGPGLVEAGIVRHAEVIALVLRNVAFALVAIVYLLQTARTSTGLVFFALLLAWSAWRLWTRNLSLALLAGDVALVVAGAILEPAIVPVTIADISMASTRMIAYPAVVAAAIAQPKRWSFTVMVVVAAACAVGDFRLFGAPSVSTIAIFAVNWWAATWVRRMVLRAGADSDTANALVRQVQLRERVAAARIRFEREQFATLHDTAASTLLMVANADRLDPERLSNQAARDVAILTDASNIVGSDTEIDLAGCIEQVSRECRTPVILQQEGRVVVSQVIAASVTAAVREALNNVDRHAFATVVRVRVAPELVTITDDGIGFDTARPRHGFGLRGSIEARMHRAGGSAEIVSAPGEGATIALRWPLAAGDDDSTSAIDVTRVLRSYQYGLAIAQLLVFIELVLIVFGGFTGIPAGLPVAVTLMLFATPLAVVAGVRFRADALRWAWVIVLAILDHWYLAALPTKELLTQQNWVTTSAGWATVALFSGWVRTRDRVVVASALVAALWLIDSAVMVWRVPTSAVAEYAGYGIGSIAAMQVGALFFGWLLAESVRNAELLGRRRHAVATQLAVEVALQNDYRHRFGSLTSRIIELLKGIADRSFDASNAHVQEQAQAEYSRLRRLFAQADSFEHPLMQRLRPMFDAAAERGVDVTFDVQTRPPDLAERDLEPVVAAIDHLVTGSCDRVRLVVSSSGSAVTVSVVTDSSDRARNLAREALGSAEFQLTVADTVTWLRVHLPVPIAA